MTDHLKASIDQIFPPEPPDDPRPEPAPPPDDALPPCPVCGGASAKGAGHWHECRSCGFAALSNDAEWRRLSHAGALLRAVERLDRHAEIDTTHPIFGSLRTDYHLLPQQGGHEWVAVGRNRMSTTCDTIADALIALGEAIDAV